MKALKSLSVVVINIFLLLWSFILYGAAGDLDVTFDNDGKVITAVSAGNDDIHSVVIQPDGKIVVAGATFLNGNQDFALARYNSDGSLDATFGADGITTADFGDNDEAFAVLLQSDSRIIVAGRAGSGGSPDADFALARFNSDGSPDFTFGIQGKVTTDFISQHDGASAAVLQTDGRIVVAGETVTLSPFRVNFALARYNPDGSLDISFDSDGKTFTDFGETSAAEGVDVQSDGRIVAAGKVANGTQFDFAVARYNPDGTPDTSFNSDGKTTTDFAVDNDLARGVVIQPDGKIVAAGVARIGTNDDFALARYNSDGSLDTSFNFDGKVNTNFLNSSDSCFAVIRQSDGKLVAAGHTSLTDFALARYNLDGSLDTDFGQNGKVTTNFGSIEIATAIALQPDGKIIAAGAIGAANPDFAMARYEGNSLPPSIFSDDYEDGILASDWTYVKPNWTESGGNLIGTPTGKKAEVIATPAFDGCTNCTMNASMQTAGGEGNKLWFLTWFLDKKNTVEVLMKEENDKWILRQRVNGSVVAKSKGLATILPNVFYNVQVIFDGINFTLIVDGATLATLPAFASPNGTLGFRVKNTTGQFGFVTVN